MVGRKRGGCSIEIAAKKGSQQADRERVYCYFRDAVEPGQRVRPVYGTKKREGIAGGRSSLARRDLRWIFLCTEIVCDLAPVRRSSSTFVYRSVLRFDRSGSSMSEINPAAVGYC